MISDSWRKDISCLVYPWDMFLREVFLRTIIQATNHLKGTRGIFPGGYCQEPIIFGIIFQEQLSREQLSGGNFPRWQLSGGQFSSGAIIWGAIIQGPIIRGGQFSSEAIVLEPLIKFAGIQACNFIKRRLRYRCFRVNIGKFL